MNITAKQVREQIIAQKAVERDKLAKFYSEKIEAMIGHAAAQNGDGCFFNVRSSEVIPQVVIDELREKGFTVSREPSLIFKGEISYSITW